MVPKHFAEIFRVFQTSDVFLKCHHQADVLASVLKTMGDFV